VEVDMLIVVEVGVRITHRVVTFSETLGLLLHLGVVVLVVD
jgi:hypothetical protein